MRIGKILIGLIVAITVISTLLLLTDKITWAQETGSDSDISKKLDEISDAQKTILREIEAIKEELRVIKIRITQNQ